MGTAATGISIPSELAHSHKSQLYLTKNTLNFNKAFTCERKSLYRLV